MPYDKITSLTNLRIKRVIHLRDRKGRKEENLTIIDGEKEIFCALSGGFSFQEIYVMQDKIPYFEQTGLLEKLVKRKVSIIEVSKLIFGKISYGDRMDGIIATGTPMVLDFSKFHLKNKALVLIVEKIEKPGNLGAILRTADSANIDAVIVSDSNYDLYNPNVIRASLGTVFVVPVFVSDNESILTTLKANKTKVYAATVDGRNNHWGVDYTGSCAIVVGSEQDGLTSFWKENADKTIQIPMRGKANSLNVSTSSAILLYEAIRQRQ